MESIEYAKTIWRHKWTMLLMLMVTIGITSVVTYFTPRKYTATATLQVTSGLLSSVPGYSSSSSEKEVSFDIYERLVKDSSFKKEVFNLTKEEYYRAEVYRLKISTFSLSAQGVPKANLLELTAEAPHPKSAKALADAASQVLFEKTTELELGASKQLRTDIINEGLKPVDKNLAKLREEMEKLSAQQTTPTLNDANEMGRLRDDFEVAKALRQTYTDFLAKLSLGNLLQQKSLQRVYPATVPSSPSSPSWPKNVLIGSVVGLIFGIGTAILLGYSKSLRDKD